uniref:SPX domain-containing protein n=1 Tax=Ditylum brightwellii TaxID=49249 RepID=A0A6V2DDP1_9STRA|mmetsp:Transcript_24585/g.36629  ORF Transcript_24585/g.36629 Transcript_24585/m.36629 type:complete len:455 (-) Transcript_24585:221-1585(-)
MKFCKNLQRIVDISDPEWAPYWTNYKMLKKLIKELPSLVPSDDGQKQQQCKYVSQQQHLKSSPENGVRPESPESVESSVSCSISLSSTTLCQQHGDKTAEISGDVDASEGNLQIHAAPPQKFVTTSYSKKPQHANQKVACSVASKPTADLNSNESMVSSTHGPKKVLEHMGKSPGEIAFFKLLHAELKKAIYFFDRAQQEFMIREERVREGMAIMKKPNSIMVGEKWSLLGKSIYRLYKDLLLLETFAIMTYCSFSKILKKHDKVTGYNTRNAFMARVVNKANFANYPVVLEMINRCQAWYEEVSDHLVSEGKEILYEDERLFINMIQKLNSQVIDTANAEGALDLSDMEDQNNKHPGLTSATRNLGGIQKSKSSPGPDSIVSPSTSSLKSLVEDMDAKVPAAHVSDESKLPSPITKKNGNENSLDGSNSQKRSSEEPLKNDINESALKRPRTL